MKIFSFSQILVYFVGLCLWCPLVQKTAASEHYLDFTKSVSENIAVGESGLIAKSTDGQHWVTVNSGVTTDLLSVAWSGDLFVAVGASGTILTSENGSVWVSRSVQSVEDFEQVFWGGQFFVAFRTDGQVFTSVDGMNWQVRPLNDPLLMPITEPQGIPTSLSYTSLVYKSPDQQMWAAATLGGIVVYKKIEWNGSSLVISDTQRGWAALTARVEYVDWLTNNNVPEPMNGPSDDHNQDGVSNLVTYAFGWDETLPVGDLTPKLTKAVGTGMISASLVRPDTERSDVWDHLEFSATLTSTSWVPIASKEPYGIWSGVGAVTESHEGQDIIHIDVGSAVFNTYSEGFVRMRLELIPAN